MNVARAPSLSVVVIGRNEGQRLTRCLESLEPLRVLGEPPEIIYVDSNSSDDSPRRAEQQGAIVIPVSPSRPCAAIGRNAGWRRARAPYVLFLDGDTILEPGFVEQALEQFQDPKTAVVWGHRRESHPETSIYNRVLDLDWIYPPGPSDFCGGDAVMRREVLERVGGYSENLIAGEEPELCQRMRQLGYIILHIDHPMTRHDLAITRWSAYWRRAVRAGYAYAEVSQRLKNSDFPLWRSEARRNAIRTVCFVGGFFAAVAALFIAKVFWPVVLFGLTVLGLALRSAYKSRWKTPNLWTLFSYGVHSHLQQIPISFGQLKYWWDRVRRRKGLLIEYK